MKTKLLSIMAMLLGAVMGMSLTACHEELKPGSDPKNETGEVNLMSMAVEINNAEKIVVSSRATIDLSDYIVEIYNAAGSRVKNFAYGQMPGVLSLPAGDYTVKVRSHEVEKAAWDKPWFTGEKTFTVQSGKMTDIGIVTCSLANIRVSIRFTDELRKYMGDDCKVTVIANDEGRLVFSADETRSGYFEALAGSSTLVAEFEGTVGGSHELLRHICRDVEAGQHRIITFKVKTPGGEDPDETGNIEIGDIRIETEVTNVDLNANVNVEEDNLGDEDRPGGNEEGGEDPGPGPDDPKSDIEITCATVQFGVPFELTNENQGIGFVANIHAPQGLKHLLVSIESTNDSFLASAGELMPLSFDLAYPGDSGEALGSIGLPVGDQVLNQTDVKFDVSGLVPLLLAFPGTHTFALTVEDNKSMSEVRSLIFVVK